MHGRTVFLTVTVICTFIVAAALFTFLEMDTCTDAGGTFDNVLSSCHAPHAANYVPLAQRPALFVFWLVFSATSLAGGLIAGSILFFVARILRYWWTDSD
jgi:hypothetical protein